MKRIGLLTCCLLLFGWGMSQTIAHDREARFGKGVNLSNWLEAYWLGGNWPEPGRFQRADLQAIKDAGMQTIRMPFCFAMVTDSVAPYTVDFNHRAFTEMDSLIQWCADLQLNLIIDNQHEWNLTNDNWQDLILPMQAMWIQIAQQYSQLDPERYFFEMLNEPPVGLLPELADSVNLACIDAFRTVDSSHTLIVGPHTASIGSSFLTFQPYADQNLIYTFHTYEPLYFTHQGFSWFPVPFPTGTPFPFLGDNALVRTSLEGVANWRITHDRPVFMGEFGTGIYGDANSRCNWVTLMGDLIDEFDFNWCYWDWGGVAPADFSMFNSVPPSASTIEPCFAQALGLYNFTQQPETIDLTHWTVWPNPVRTTLHFKSLEGGVSLKKVTIVDMAGKAVKTWQGNQRHTLSLDMSGLPAGWYQAHLEDVKGKKGSLKISLSR